MTLEASSEEFFKQLFVNMGEDPEREGLQKTPKRVLRCFQELTKGYHVAPKDFFRDALFDCEYEEMVWVKNIPFYSLCEHHLIPFFGRCTVAYLPNGKVFGLSKIGQIVEMYARRLQLQERFTTQVANTLQDLGKTRGVGVFVQAKHLCVAMRGVRKESSETVTYSMLGQFKTEANVRKEFLTGIQNISECALAIPVSDLKLKTLRMPVSLGCWPAEKKEKTIVELELTLKYDDLPKACYTDQLADTVCYDQLLRDVMAFCATKHFDLIEHLGYEIYRFLKAQRMPSVRIKVCLLKPLKSAAADQSVFSIGDFNSLV